MRRRYRLGLRARSTAAWALGALVLSVGLSLVAYQLTRAELVEDRQDRATGQAYGNARLLRSGLRTDAQQDVSALLAALSGNAGAQTLAWIDGEWYSGTVGISPDRLPTSLTVAVADGVAGSQISWVEGRPYVVVGVPIAEQGARYFELVPAEDIESSLAGLARGLAAAAVVATVIGALAGWYVSRRVLTPVRRLSEAATEIADGDLEARLDALGDQDLEELQHSFNRMADAVQQRIERERRFASDVSHELRSPLAAMISSLEVARRRVDDPKAVAETLDQLSERAEAFSGLVVDLLEISRLDAGMADFHPEAIEPRAMVGAVLASAGDDEVPVLVVGDAPSVVWADKRRVGQMLLNLVQNADRYAGGVTGVEIAGDLETLRIAVLDDGPGVAPHERRHIFGRFARGESGRAATAEGTGLGLALVAEHARLHGGRVDVESNGSGGARFVVEIPVGEEPP